MSYPTTILSLLLLACAACGKAETEPAQPQAQPQAQVQPQPEDVAIPPADPVKNKAAKHPHPEWAEIEIDTTTIVSAISPEDYEQQIRAALKHHGTLEDPVPLTVDFLGAWRFDETKADPFPPHVQAVNGAYVTMSGFMLPDVDFEGITQFNLVRSLWGCCFGAPPRANEMVLVHTPDSGGIEYTYNTLQVVGRLKVELQIEDGLIGNLYQISAEQLVETEFQDPLAPQGADPQQLVDQLSEMEF